MNTSQTNENQANANPKGIKSKEQWIQEVQERLDWYTFQASEDEFDAQEVEVLVALLGTLEAGSTAQMPEPKTDFEAFMRYQEEKAADAEQLAALHHKAELKAELTASEASGEFAETTKSAEIMKLAESAEIPNGTKPDISSDSAAPRSAGRILGGRHRFVKIASVAALLVALTVGGAVGAVNAAKGGDYILWLRKDKDGEKLVIEPQKNTLNQAKQETGSIYYNVEDVPEEYGQYLVDFDAMENLKDYELVQIEVSKHKGGWRMSSLLQTGEQKIWLGVWAYEDYAAVQEKSFAGYERIYSKEIDGRELEVYQKQDNTEGWDEIICFYDKNIQYFVYGKCSVEALEALAAEYAKKVF